ncbi:MAG TPA: 50S ribosomal protein L9 [Alphaproteobacteria bacterium]
MQVILLEKIERLGALGQEVRVKDGYARNFLLPKGKALRATDANRAYYQSQKAALEAANAKRRDAASTEAKKLDKLTVNIIRQAAEGGQLYGSVSARDVADAVTAATKVQVDRHHVVVNDSFKTLGLFKVNIALHPEVKTEVTINIARTEEEAAIQKKTGKALVKNDADDKETAKAEKEVAADAALATPAEEAAE